MLHLDLLSEGGGAEVGGEVVLAGGGGGGTVVVVGFVVVVVWCWEFCSLFITVSFSIYISISFRDTTLYKITNR